MVVRNFCSIAALALLSSPQSFAVTCAEIDYPEEAKISVVIEDTDHDPREVSVRVPSVVFGKSLTWVFLWVRPDSKTGQLDLQVPIQFKVDGSEAYAEFSARKNWNAVEITAHYGDQICDPQLELALWN